MEHRSQDSWRKGKKSSPREAAREAAATPSWKRSRTRAAAAGGAAGGGRRNFKILFPIVLLSLFVALAIWMFWFGTKVHTHIVVLDLLTDSGSFDAVSAPAFPEVASQRTGETTKEHLASLNFNAEEAQDNLSKAHAIVVHLQTQIVRDADGTLLCLFKSSTPDLATTEQSEPLEWLKQSLMDVCAQSTAKGVLLLVDCPASIQDARLGRLPTAIHEELSTWPENDDLKNLVVMLSCGPSQDSASGPIGSGGQSVFGHTVARGFSQAANVDGDETLTVSEFCQFVQQQTTTWVRNHRHGEQTVHVWPSLDDLHSAQKNFTLMTELPDAPAEPEFRNPGDIVSNIDAAWKTRAQLDEKQAWRWSPLNWQAATEYLLRAQTAMLNGNTPLAQQQLQQAESQLQRLTTATAAIVPTLATLNTSLGLPRAWIADFPYASRLNDLWSSDEPLLEFKRPAIEQVLKANARADNYPWQAVGLPVPDNNVLDHLTRQRSFAERAALSAWGLAPSLRKTVMTNEQRLLTSEDLLFTRPTEDPATPPTTSPVTASWEAVKRFAEAHQQAEAQFQHTLTSTESLSRWAARFPFSDNEQALTEWRSLLTDNLPTRDLTPEDAEALMRKAEVAGLNQSSAVQLRSDVFRLLVAARVLGSMLHPTEPDTGFETADLNQLADQLQTWRQKTATAARDVQTRLSVTIERFQSLPQTRLERVQLWGKLRETVDITSLSPAVRQTLVTAMLTLEERLADKTDLLDPDTATASTAATAPQIALWHLQHLALLSGPEDAAAELKTATAAVHTMLQRSSGDGADQQSVAQFGQAIRDYWQVSSRQAKDALNASGDRAVQDLLLADRRCRAMSAFDELNPAPTTRLHAWQRVEDCLLQIDRLLQNQWIQPGEAAPLLDNGWYATVASDWMQHIAVITKNNSSSYGSGPEFIQKALKQRTQSLAASAGWTVAVSVDTENVNIGEQNKSTQTVPMTIAVQGSLPDVATAAVRFVPDRNSPSSQRINFTDNAQPVLLNSAASVTATVKREGNPGSADCESVRYTPSVFFRGRQWTANSLVAVNPCAAEEFVVTRLARPTTAGAIVGGNDQRPIVFILDMSLSMDQNKLANGQTRSSAALETMEKIVNREQFDQNDTAFLKVFGHRVKYVEGEGNVINEKYTDHFRDAPNPAGVTAIRDVRTEVPQTPLNDRGKAIFLDVIRRLRISGAFGITPLVRAITEALNNDLGSKPGVIVAITDGAASDAGGIYDVTPALKAALDENPGSRIIIVAFDFANDVDGRKNLEDTFGRYDNVEIIDANDQAQLTQKIQKALEPRSWTIAGDSGRVDRQEKFEQVLSGLPVAADYNIAFDRIRTKQPIFLGPGDLVRLTVQWADSTFHFDRAKSNRVFVKSTASGLDSTTPTTLRLMGDSRNQDRVSVHLMLDHDSEDDPVRQPAEIEFHITSLDKFRSRSVKEEYTSQWHAPGYKLTVEEWPVNQKVQVDAFWKAGRTEPEQVIACSQLSQTKSLTARGLPAAQLSSTLRDNGVLEIRLTPERPTPDPDFSGNTVQNVRIEIGSTGELTGNDRFVPDEVLTRITRTETGEVVYEFLGDYSADSLADREIAFTSKAARLRDAVTPGRLEVR